MKPRSNQKTQQESANPTQQLDMERIQERAHQLYMDRGQEPGHELDDWLQAEREVAEQKPERRVG